ncbi:MAG: polymer-forming cytoskeletal protein [Steroidobacteraceae bacterium]|nr:polymer-forming cytoskeletal protein [Steroidobacteraceae bacterium]MDW8258783.1 polymer-forming cytoskeletal protein [Gammaproteobacteria bacterium]
MFGSKKDKVTGKVDTLIAHTARIEGNVHFSGGLHLDGRVVGNVRSVAGQDATLWVSEKGEVEGNIDVAVVVLNGSVKGDIQARERLVLGPQARVTGDVQYGSMEMAEGAAVNGKLSPLTAAVASANAGTTSGVSGKPALPVFDARHPAT